MKTHDSPLIVITVIVSYILGVSAVILFTVFKDSNYLINLLATILLLIPCIMFMYLKFYIDIRPIWIGIVFTIILFVSFMAISFAIKFINIQLSYVFAIPLVFGLAIILRLFKKRIVDYLLTLTKLIKMKIHH